jgi:hypothetical protein
VAPRHAEDPCFRKSALILLSKKGLWSLSLVPTLQASCFTQKGISQFTDKDGRRAACIPGRISRCRREYLVAEHARNCSPEPAVPGPAALLNTGLTNLARSTGRRPADPARPPARFTPRRMSADLQTAPYYRAEKRNALMISPSPVTGRTRISSVRLSAQKTTASLLLQPSYMVRLPYHILREAEYKAHMDDNPSFDKGLFSSE